MKPVTTNIDGTVLTRGQAAAFLQVCINSLDKLPIPKIQAGRRVLYRRQAIEQWLAKSEGVSHGRKRSKA